jgi:hypothetical protein
MQNVVKKHILIAFLILIYIFLYNLIAKAEVFVETLKVIKSTDLCSNTTEIYVSEIHGGMDCINILETR